MLKLLKEERTSANSNNKNLFLKIKISGNRTYKK